MLLVKIVVGQSNEKNAISQEGIVIIKEEKEP